MVTHNTIVVGINENKEIKFFKSFDYHNEKNQAQQALSHAQTFYSWYISAIGEGGWKLVHLDKEEDIEFKL